MKQDDFLSAVLLLDSAVDDLNLLPMLPMLVFLKEAAYKMYTIKKQVDADLLSALCRSLQHACGQLAWHAELPKLIRETLFALCRFQQRNSEAEESALRALCVQQAEAIRFFREGEKRTGELLRTHYQDHPEVCRDEKQRWQAQRKALEENYEQLLLLFRSACRRKLNSAVSQRTAQMKRIAPLEEKRMQLRQHDEQLIREEMFQEKCRKVLNQGG